MIRVASVESLSPGGGKRKCHFLSWCFRIPRARLGSSYGNHAQRANSSTVLRFCKEAFCALTRKQRYIIATSRCDKIMFRLQWLQLTAGSMSSVASKEALAKLYFRIQFQAFVLLQHAQFC
jgi:hypothetical protein